MDPLDHLKDIYGACTMGVSCKCLQPVKRTSPLQMPLWLGRYCPHWKPDVPAALLKALEVKNAEG